MFRLVADNRRILLPALLLLYWAIGFYPFVPQLPVLRDANAVIAPPSGGLRFPAPGIAFTADPPEWLATAAASSELELNLELRAASERQQGPARILTISGNTRERNLTVGQQGRNLILRLRNPLTSLNGTPDYVVPKVFAQDGWHRVEVRVTANALTIAVDGRERLRQVLPPTPLAQWNNDFRLALGNEFGFKRPWLGELRRVDVTVAGKRHDYLSAGMLETPAVYWRLRPNLGIQLVPFADRVYGGSLLTDRLVNLFGFMPFGFALAVLLRAPRGVWSIAALCLAMSLSIECGQIFLGTRSPSIDDLILNTLGGALGGWFGLRGRRSAAVA